MKTIFSIVLFVASVSLFAQKYTVTIETHIAGKPEDKFSFVIRENESQYKGFDGRLHAKRYMGKGFSANSKVEFPKKEDSTTEKAEPKKKIKPIDEARAKHAIMLDNVMRLDGAIESAKSQKERVSIQCDELGAVLESAERGSNIFEREYKKYLDKYEKRDAEKERIDALFRNRPKNTGDVEIFDMGSCCGFKLKKVEGKKAIVDFNYIFSNLVGYMYSEGNNNDNSIMKHPRFERIMKKVRNLEVNLNRTYCIQFERPNLDSEGDLKDALANTQFFSDGDNAGSSAKASTVAEKEGTPSEFDIQGSYAEVRRKFPNGLNKTVRILITVRKGAR